jgi:hypothetical protein
MKRLPIILLIAFCLLAFLTISCGGNGGNPPSDTINNFYRAIEDEQYSEAKNYLTASALEEFTSDMFDLGVRGMNAAGGLKDIHIIDTEYHENEAGEYTEWAEVNYRVTFNNGSYDEAAHTLVVEDGKWKIADF